MNPDSRIFTQKKPENRGMAAQDARLYAPRSVVADALPLRLARIHNAILNNRYVVYTTHYRLSFYHRRKTLHSSQCNSSHSYRCSS